MSEIKSPGVTSKVKNLSAVGQTCGLFPTTYCVRVIAEVEPLNFLSIHISALRWSIPLYCENPKLGVTLKYGEIFVNGLESYPSCVVTSIPPPAYNIELLTKFL